MRIKDPVKASYGVDNAKFALMLLAQTTMRSELGKISLDNTFEERERLNSNIVRAINDAGAAWGIECLRYEIRDISPPPSVKVAMDMQAEAERRKRADILTSEGQREAAINQADGIKKSIILRAEAEASAIVARAAATAEGISRLARAVGSPQGQRAVSVRLAEQYVSAFAKLARSGTTMIVPADASDPAAMVARAMAVFQGVTKSATPTVTDLTAAATDDDHVPDGDNDSSGDAIASQVASDSYAASAIAAGSPPSWSSPSSPSSHDDLVGSATTSTSARHDDIWGRR